MSAENPFAPPSGPTPAYGAPPPPPPPYSSGSGWYQPPQHLPTNPWAVVALITGLVALVPIAVPSGIVALVQLHRRPGRGSGMAIAGLVLSAVWLAVGLLVGIGFTLSGFFGDGAYGPLGRVGDAGTTTVGGCLTAPSGTSSYAPETDCSSEHDAEVSLVATLPDGAFPGYDDLDNSSDDRCLRAMESYVGRSFDDSDLDYGWFAPDDAEWRAGERRVVCVVTAGTRDTLRGSVRGRRI